MDLRKFCLLYHVLRHLIPPACRGLPAGNLAYNLRAGLINLHEPFGRSAWLRRAAGPESRTVEGKRSSGRKALFVHVQFFSISALTMSGP